MARYAAFLQGINLGPTRKVPMARLKAVLEGLGYDGVVTLLNSGNVVFSATKRAPALERAIEGALAAEVGFAVDTFVRSAVEVVALAAHDPFPGVERREGDRLHVTFLRKELPAEVARRLAGLSNDDDLLAVEGREVWHLRRGKLMDSTLPAGALDAATLGPHTSRNLSTVQRVAAKLT